MAYSRDTHPSGRVDEEAGFSVIEQAINPEQSAVTSVRPHVGPIVISSSGSGTSLANYAAHCWRVLGPDSTLIQLRLTENSTANELPRSNRVLLLPGVKTGAHSVDAALMNLLPGLSFRGYAERIKQAEHDRRLVHFTSAEVPPVGSGRGAVVTILDNPRSVMSPDLYGLSASYRRVFWFHMQFYRNLPNILAPSDYVRRRLLEFGVTGTITVIPPPADEAFRPTEMPTARQELGLPLKKPCILSISTAEPRKNLKSVARVAHRLGQGFSVVRVGPPVNGALNLGRVSPQDLVKLYNACDAMLFPSLEEGFGLPVIEAFATGLPVVASNIDVVREVAGDAAVLVEPLDVDGLVRGIRTVLSDREEYRARGLRQSQNYSFGRFQDRMSRYFQTLQAEAN